MENLIEIQDVVKRFGEQTVLDLRLEEEVAEMDEVVVNGYFTKSKNSYTGAVKTITNDQLKSVSNTNIIAAISALTPGLNLVERSDLGSNPNRVPELLLRGMSSFSSGTRVVNQPTIMLDGVEISMARWRCSSTTPDARVPPAATRSVSMEIGRAHV